MKSVNLMGKTLLFAMLSVAPFAAAAVGSGPASVRKEVLSEDLAKKWNDSYLGRACAQFAKYCPSALNLNEVNFYRNPQKAVVPAAVVVVAASVYFRKNIVNGVNSIASGVKKTYKKARNYATGAEEDETTAEVK